VDKQSQNEDLKARAEAHWQENVQLITILLFIWFVVTFIPAIFADALNDIKVLTGFPLDYYMGAQGSLIVFVVLISYYAYKMDQIDKKYGMQEEF
jgi:putative solute:sodium symporter small subunit